MVLSASLRRDGRRGTGLYIPFAPSSHEHKAAHSRSQFVFALLPLKGVLPIWRHHPFSRQPEQRYNTLDFAKAKSCAKRENPSLDTPSIFSYGYPHRQFCNSLCQYTTQKSAKQSAAFSSCLDENSALPFALLSKICVSSACRHTHFSEPLRWTIARRNTKNP